jgi:aspartyl-tRNA(Asn)/glutamyl-tRNA(Gln) amidotransferase subunit C
VSAVWDRITVVAVPHPSRLTQPWHKKADVVNTRRKTLVSSHSLTPQQVRDVADLARLELSDSELETMARQLGAIVDYVAQLQQVPTEGVEPLAHALPVSNVFRDDTPAESLPVDEALANAPDRRRTNRGEHFYGVPAVLE